MTIYHHLILKGRNSMPEDVKNIYLCCLPINCMASCTYMVLNNIATQCNKPDEKKCCFEKEAVVKVITEE